MFVRSLILAVMLWLLTAVGVGAQSLSFDFDSAVLSGHRGDTVTFSATLINTSGADLYLNGYDFTPLASGLTLDDTKFFTNPPYPMTDATPWHGELFDIKIDPTLKPGDYLGTFTIKGGATNTADAVLAFQNFQVTVVPVPGALMTALLGGLPGAGLLLRRRRR
ncbi:MAG TPA: hypothetical protein VFB21_21320 [Chthonomonadaceae bacterium]|nr:hypothetical protein [Chthonomonadaceae bacterium]